MRVDVLTKEYPPAIYGGAGVHVTELVKALRRTTEVQVRCFGAPRDESDVTAYEVPTALDSANGALQTLAVDLQMAAATEGADIVHSHTWYANEAGRLSQTLYDVPHVVTAHSLEPLRPWKAEQLGGGYTISSDIERRTYEAADRVIAVSNGMRADILRSYPALDPAKVVTIVNGIDLESWAPNPDGARARELGLEPDAPSVIFVGRITRQKGLPHLLRAARELPPDVQLILCAGAPDTPEIMAEVQELVRDLRTHRDGVVWIDRVLPREDLTALLSNATTFVCPSVYEPLGIVNLEAMACGTAVVGSATGGIPEVIDDGVTGVLVPIDQVQDGTGRPIDPQQFQSDLAAALTRMVAEPEAARQMGARGRERAREHFDWNQIAAQTLEVYSQAIGERRSLSA